MPRAPQHPAVHPAASALVPQRSAASAPHGVAATPALAGAGSRLRRGLNRGWSLGLALDVWGLGAPAVHAQSLAELVEAARAYDAGYLAARAAADATVARADQAQAGLLPTVGLSAGLNRSHIDNASPVADRSVGSRNLTVAASHPLYRPANRLAAQQGDASRQVAQAQLKLAEQDLIIRTTQAYFDVLAAQDTLTFVTAQKAAVAEQLAAAKRNFEVGTSTVTDAREAQAKFDLVVAQEIAAENDLRVKRLALDTVVGRTGTDPKPLARPVVLPAVEPDDVAHWARLAETEHPAVVQAQTALDIARLETQKARAGHGPTVDLTGQFGWSRAPSSTTGLPLRSQTATVGVQLNLPLFAGYAIQNRVRETLALEDKAVADADAARRSVVQATRTAFFGVQSGKGQVRALEAAEASSQSALDANQLGYQVGVRINIDVLNAQSQLYQTKRDLAVARYNVLLGSLKLRQASGALGPDDVAAVSALMAR